MSDKKKKAGKNAEPLELDAYDELLGEDAPVPAKKKSGKKKEAVSSRPYDELDDAFPVKAKKKKRAASAKTDENGLDEYDRLLEEDEPPRKHGKKSGTFGMAMALLLCIFAVTGLGIRQYAAYQDFKVMRELVSQQEFYDGIIVDGIDVSGMTLENALLHWENNVEPAYENVSVQIEGGTTLNAVQLGYTSDYREVLRKAWQAGRSGALDKRYREIQKWKRNTVSYSVDRQLYTEDMLNRCVDAYAQTVNASAKSAGIQSFDMDTHTFVFSEGSSGYSLDSEKLHDDIAAAVTVGGGTVTPDVTELVQTVTKEEMEASYGMITSAVTSASSSSDNRLNNIRIALASINGTCLKPGEEFSFNGTVGKRTTERGYKEAPAYNSGTVTKQVGGGICQVSTTLFNAAVKADLEIVERHNHSIPVGYVDKGKDATVNWGNQDFRFKNTTDDDIYIVCYLTDKKRVQVEIYGKLIPDGKYITVESYTTETIESQTEYKINSNLASGASVVTQEGRTGYKAVAYKILWSADGEKLAKAEVCRSTYPARNTIIEVAP